MDMTIQQNLLTGGAGNINAVVVRTLAPNASLQRSGSNLQLTWPYGTLLEAMNILGPWTTNAATSPLLITPSSAPAKFFRIQYP